MTISVMFTKQLQLIIILNLHIWVLRLTLLSYREFERSALEKLVGMAYQKYMVNLIYGMIPFCTIYICRFTFVYKLLSLFFYPYDGNSYMLHGKLDSLTSSDIVVSLYNND